MKFMLSLILMIFSCVPTLADIIGMKANRVATETEMKESVSKIKLADETGRIIELKSLIGNGKPSLVTLWAHWCLNCRSEISGYRAISERCPNSWNIIFISARASDYAKDIARFGTFSLPWKFYHVVEEARVKSDDYKVTRAFYGTTIDDGILTPLHYFISSSGKVQAIVNAKMDFASPEKLDAICDK